VNFDREPDLDNANVGTPMEILCGSHLRNQVASVFYLTRKERNNGF
jgi:hypothetical protein